MWQNFLAAIGLMLVLEGIMPFLSPDRVRRTLLQLSQMEDGVLRTIGLISMLIGLAILYFFVEPLY
jgi:uncharacterized protein YjeT (DUF2065 family)